MFYTTFIVVLLLEGQYVTHLSRFTMLIVSKAFVGGIFEEIVLMMRRLL